MSNPNIAFYCSSLSYGGLEINIIRILTWLQEIDWNVCLFAQDESPITESAKKNSIYTVGIKRSSRYFDLKNARILSELCKQLKVEVLFIGTTEDISLAYILKLIYNRKIKTVYHQQMQLGIRKRDIIHTLRFKKLDAWIAPLPYLANEVREKTRYNIKNVYIIPLCIDTSKFTNSIYTKSAGRRMLYLPKNKFFIGILGRIDPHKRQDFLIRALKFIDQHTTDIDLVIMGETTRNEGNDYYNFVIHQIEECGLEKRVHIRPFSEDTISFYKSIDIFAMTTDSETFGMVTVEAMANGVPVIATNSGGSVEILGNGEYGLLFEANDIKTFCDHVIKIYKENEFAKELGEKAKKQAINEYDKSIEIRQFEKLIYKLTNSTNELI